MSITRTDLLIGKMGRGSGATWAGKVMLRTARHGARPFKTTAMEMPGTKRLSNSHQWKRCGPLGQAGRKKTGAGRAAGRTSWHPGCIHDIHPASGVRIGMAGSRASTRRDYERMIMGDMGGGNWPKTRPRQSSQPASQPSGRLREGKMSRSRTRFECHPVQQ